MIQDQDDNETTGIYLDIWNLSFKRRPTSHHPVAAQGLLGRRAKGSASATCTSSAWCQDGLHAEYTSRIWRLCNSQGAWKALLWGWWKAWWWWFWIKSTEKDKMLKMITYKLMYDKTIKNNKCLAFQCWSSCGWSGWSDFLTMFPKFPAKVHVMIHIMRWPVRFHRHARGCGENDPPNRLHKPMAEDITVHP